MGTESSSFTQRNARRSLTVSCLVTRVVCILLGAGLLQTAAAQIGLPNSWTSSGPLTAPARIMALAADPRSDSTLYFAAPGGGVWKSPDGGQGWTALMDAAATLQVCSVAVNPMSPDTVYAGTGDELSPRPAQGVARSTDAGRTWSLGVRFTNRPVCTLAVDPLSGARLLAGSSEGLFLSTDSGTSWKKVISRQVSEVAFDGQGNVYAGVLAPDSEGLRQNLLARSSDGGQTWTNIPLPVPEGGAGQTNWISPVARGNSIWAVLLYQSLVSTSPQMDFLRSVDGGNTWALTSIGSGGTRVQLVVDAEARNFYVASRTVLRSLNQGVTWSRIGTVTQQFNAARLTGDSLLLAGERGLELIPLLSGTPGAVVSNFAVGQFLGVSTDTLNSPWAGGPMGLFGIVAGVPDWKAAVTSAPVGFVAGAPSALQNIFAAANASVFRSTNGGNSFSATTAITAGELRAPYPPMVLDPVNFATLFTAGRRVFRSTDSGATWTALGTVDSENGRVVTALAVASFARQIMYAATACLPEVTPTLSCPNNSNIWRSQNTGQTWTRVATVTGPVNRLAVDPRQAAIVYAAVGAFPGGPSASAGYGTGDVLRLTQNPDGTLAPVSIRANLPQVPINTIVIDATSSANFFLPAQTLYVGTDAGVFVSFNAGAQWTAFNNGLPATPITDLTLRQPGGTLYAATFGRGVYRASVSGFAATLIVNPLSVEVALVQGNTATAGASLTNLSASRVDWQPAALDSWLSVAQTTGQVEARGAAQVTFQVSAAGLLAGIYRGRVRVTAGITGASGNPQDILVTLRVIAAPARMVITGGNNASGLAGSTLPPLTVQVLDADGLPLAGVPITFAITSGGGSLSARTVVSDTNGRASTLLTLPGTPGTVQMVATAGPVSATFTATAVPSVQTTLVVAAVVNGATFSATAPVALGSIIAIFGRNLAESSSAASALPLPARLLATRALLGPPSGEIALPLFYVSPDQVNALLPLDVAPGAYPLTVENGASRATSIQIVVALQAPGIFSMNSSGRGPGVFLGSDGSLVTVANPARRGSVVALYATGLGAVDPPVPPGSPGAAAEPLNRTLLTPSVRFDIYDAEVLYSGLAPGFAGLYQVNVRVPSLVSPATNIPLSLNIGGVTSNTVTIPVQ